MIKRVLLGLISSSILFTSGVLVGAQSFEARLNPLPAAPVYQANVEESALSALYNDVVRGVVNINVAGNSAPLGTGSGFLIDTTGHIVTNNHVVEGAAFIEVTFVDGTILEAELIGRNPDWDIAVIRVDSGAIPTVRPLSLADSETVFIGQSVLAIGSPFGEDFTLTRGIVSAVDRSLRSQTALGFSIPEVIQTDAAINPGNSGGPLLDQAGTVIGMNTAILSEDRTSSGVGFAVPSNLIRWIVPYLIEEGSYQHSYLGISGSDLHPAIQAAMNLAPETRGVMWPG
ncbi:MAG: trypsin-like serine protease [Anaerolineae bacterium]|nr:trypsin-like serine protease [Anaerolineae bacterium]